MCLVCAYFSIFLWFTPFTHYHHYCFYSSHSLTACLQFVADCLSNSYSFTATTCLQFVIQSMTIRPAFPWPLFNSSSNPWRLVQQASLEVEMSAVIEPRDWLWNGDAAIRVPLRECWDATKFAKRNLLAQTFVLSISFTYYSPCNTLNKETSIRILYRKITNI